MIDSIQDSSGWPIAAATSYREAGYWTGETLAQLVKARAQSHPQQIALIDSSRRLSYSQFHVQTERLAAGFLALGLKQRDIVVLQIPNYIELFETLVALASLGVVPVLALPAHRKFELQAFAEITQAKAIVSTGKHLGFDYAALAQEVTTAVPSLKQALLVMPPAISNAKPLSSRQVPRLTPVTHPEPMAADTLLLQLSGGSTGTPKLIPRTHDDYLYSVRASVKAADWTQATRYLAALPAQHNFPLSSPGVLGALHVGGCAVLSESPAPSSAFAWIEQEAITCTSLVPSLVKVWLAAAKLNRAKLTTLQVLQVGGAPFPNSLARRVLPEMGCQLQQVFGMAEGLVCYTRLNDPQALIESCQGKPMSPGDELRVLGDDGKPVNPGEEGELWVRGPYTIRAYYRDEQEHATRFTTNGFYRTGDRVRILPSSDLVIVGRSKDQINRGGDKIATAEIEAHLLAHPAVADVAVVGLEDTYLGQRSCAFVVPDEKTLSARELRQFVRERGIAAYKIPDAFEFLTQLPRTAIGKVDKRALKSTQ